MNLNQQSKPKRTLLSVITFIGVCILLPHGMDFFFELDETAGLQTASANMKHGILGRPAPELNLTTWIDGAGNPMDSVKLKDYRGKVIFLYFFQDW